PPTIQQLATSPAVMDRRYSAQARLFVQFPSSARRGIAPFSTLADRRPEDPPELSLLPEFRKQALRWSASERKSTPRFATRCAPPWPDREYRPRSCRCTPRKPHRSRGWRPWLP